MALSRRGFCQQLGAGGAAALAAACARPRAVVEPGAPDRITRPIRLGSNENPVGPAPVVLDAVRSSLVEANRYPWRAIAALTEQIAGAHGVNPSHVVLGCGSSEILRAAAEMYTSPSRPLVTAAPSFELPADVARSNGAEVRDVPLDHELRLDLRSMAGRAPGAGLVYVCNPNNPTGTVLGAGILRSFVEEVDRSPDPPVVLVDEAYHEYVEADGYASLVPLVRERPRLLVLRTFSKAHGLAGLRLGYAIGQPQLLAPLRSRMSTLNLSNAGLAAAAASLQATAHLASERARNREVRAWTAQAFRGAGYRVASSDANFVMVDVRCDSRRFQGACFEEGVLVARPFPPLTTWARVSIGTMEEMRTAVDVCLRAIDRATGTADTSSFAAATREADRWLAGSC